MDGIIGHINLTSLLRTPEGWWDCDGRRLSVKGNPELFRVLGTRFGGDGIEDFGNPKIDSLPDVNGNSMRYIICHAGVFPARP